MVKSSRQKKGEVIIDATISIAGISYDERRVLRLSHKGQRMKVLSLGKIERASDDPEWLPKPDAGFRRVDDPEQVETLLRCPHTPAFPWENADLWN